MNKKFKKIVISLLSVLMIFTYMPAMAFAEGEGATFAGAYVTTDDTTEPIPYDTFEEALTATNTSANAEKNAVITLNEDATLSGNVTIAIPLKINLNGKKLTEANGKALDPAKGSWGGNDEDICRKDSDSEIIFATHELSASTIYNWAKRENNDAWHVVSMTGVCDNCGQHETTITETNTNNPQQSNLYRTTPTTPTLGADGKYTYQFQRSRRSSGWSHVWETQDTKVIDGPEADKYSLKGTTKFVSVNGKTQYKDGVPVVEAGLQDALGNDVDPTIVIAEATKAELDAEGLKVYAENGTTQVSKPYNSDPTCTAEGKKTYKVEVKDPDGKVVETKYLQDSKAVAKTGHVKGALKGYKLLEKAVAEGATSEADAVKAGTDAGKSVVKVTTEKSGSTTIYYYWFYGDLKEIPAAKEQNTSKSVTIADKNLNADGSFDVLPVYYCNFETQNEVDDKAFTVSPYANATTAAQADDGTHSSCTKWAYASKPITYTFNKAGQETQSTLTCTLTFGQTNKPESAYSHVSDGTYSVITDSTCQTEGVAKIKCAICGDEDVEVAIPKKADTFGPFPGTSTPSATSIDSKCSSRQKVTLNSDRTEATIAPTCEHAGGTYKYCTANHWVLQTKTPATGHNLVVNVGGFWSQNLDYAAQDADYYYQGIMMCSNTACENPFGVFQVTYHSKAGTDTITDKYNAIEIVKEEKGKDCKTNAKTVYTVKDIKDRTGATITTTVNGPDSTRGDHVLEVKNFNWSSDFKAATVTTKCTVKDCPEADQTFTKEAKVTKAVDATGMTTYTATYADKSESKKAYTLAGAEVTYDTSKLTDGNLVLGVTGASAQTPEVTVKLDGVVIDSKELKEVWGYNNNTVTLYVTWADDKAFDEEATIMTGSENTRAYAKEFKVAAKSKFNAPTVVVKKGAETATAPYTGTYDPATAWSVVATSAVKDATVKYFVSDKAITEQSDIDLLAFDLDKVDDIKNAGTYYVYAQQSKDGYTNYSRLAATITIAKMTVSVSIDNFTMKEGETPDYKMTVTANGSLVEVDKAQFNVTSAGGQKLEDLIPGDYRLLVTSDNYNVDTVFTEGRVGTVTVLTVDGKTAEEEAKAMAAAADAALADAAKINTKNYVDESVKNVAAAKAALEEALKSGDRKTIKAATAALEDAIKNAVAKKANPMKVKAKTVKAKAKKTMKFAAKKAFTVKKAQGKVTYKQTTKNKKIKVAKNGKVTVKKGLKKGKTFKIKVKVTAAGNANYKKGVKTVTLKVKVK